MAVRDLTEDQQDQVWERRRAGDSLRKVGRDIGATTWEVRQYILSCGGGAPAAEAATEASPDPR